MKVLAHGNDGQEPLTIRYLSLLAEREGWDLDAPITYQDPEEGWYFVARGAQLSEVSLGEHRAVDLDFHHEDNWVEEESA